LLDILEEGFAKRLISDVSTARRRNEHEESIRAFSGFDGASEQPQEQVKPAPPQNQELESGKPPTNPPMSSQFLDSDLTPNVRDVPSSSRS
jgi:hypothetical protein